MIYLLGCLFQVFLDYAFVRKLLAQSCVNTTYIHPFAILNGFMNPCSCNLFPSQLLVWKVCKSMRWDIVKVIM